MLLKRVFKIYLNQNKIIILNSLESLEIVEILINNGFSITKNDIKLAFEIGESRIWWLLKSKKNLKATTEKKDSLNSNPENIEMNQDFLFLRNENENLKKKIPEYEVNFF